MKILYAGDSEVGGPANYLLGILQFLKADFRHLPPSKILKPHWLKEKYDAIVLSDFSRTHAPSASQKLIAEQVARGTGLLMIGGWGSFSGPFGGWRGSLVEKLLPVACLKRDDRVHFPGGATVIPSSLVILRAKPEESLNSEILRPFGAQNDEQPPVICGLNQIRPKKESLTLLSARKIMVRGGLRWGREYPLLVIHSDPQKRIAALATDLAPHWSGGWVDWGRKRIGLRITNKVQIEVGQLYLQFVTSLLRWLTRDL